MHCGFDRIIGSYNGRQIVLNDNCVVKLHARYITAIGSHFSMNNKATRSQMFVLGVLLVLACASVKAQTCPE